MLYLPLKCHIIMLPSWGALSDDALLTSVCLSVAYIANIHGTHSCWSKAHWEPQARRVWAEAERRCAAYMGGGGLVPLVHRLFH